MKNSDTTIIDTENSGFVPATGGVADKGTQSTSSSPPEVTKYDAIKYIPGVLGYLESKFSFTAILLSLIGYIVIAAFGQMNSVGKYFAYILFLLVLFSFYKYSEREEDFNSEAKRKVSISYFLLIGFIVFFCYAVYMNFDKIKGAYISLNTYFIKEDTNDKKPVTSPTLDNSEDKKTPQPSLAPSVRNP
jgi:amino acid transporter